METIGQQLRQAREAQKYTLQQVASATLMRERYLRALEEEDYASLPSQTQARGFLRAYASFLKLDPEPMLKTLDGGPGPQPAANMPSTVAAPIVDTPLPGYDKAEDIYRDVGRRLQVQRELLGLSLDDVVRYTHLRRHYLQALEAGKIDDLPSPVQGRGMLDNYAVFLGMDAEPLLLRFAEGLQVRLTARQAMAEPSTQPAVRKRRSLPAPLRRLLSPDILIGVTFAIFLVLFVGWSAIRIFSMNANPPQEPTTPSIAEILLATETPAPTQPPVLDTPALPEQAVSLPDASGADATAILLPPTGGPPGAQVYLTVLQRAWLRATVDGKVEFEGRVIPGSAYSFVGESNVEILTGNGAALQVFYNGQDLGLMGDFGQVVNRIFTTQGILTPTPTVTRTPTTVPIATPTVTLPNIPVSP